MDVPADSKNVCNIKVIMLLRLICGLYNDIHHSKLIQWLSRIYCVLLPFGLIYTFYHTAGDFMIYVVVFLSVEYIAYVIISLYNKDFYIQKHYRKISSVDRLIDPKTFRRLENFFKYFPLGLIIIRCIISYFFCYKCTEICLENKGLLISDFIISNAIMLGKLSILLILFLTYYRVKNMLKTLEVNGFQNTPRGRFHLQKYAQIYKNIMQSIEESNNITKFQALISLVCTMSNVSIAITYVLYGFKLIGTDSTSLVWISLQIVYHFSIFFISSILSDLVKLYFQRMIVIVIEYRIACENERTRAEIQKLYQLMKETPYQYTVCGIMLLNVRNFLGLFSFAVTTVIAILQISFAF